MLWIRDPSVSLSMLGLLVVNCFGVKTAVLSWLTFGEAFGPDCPSTFSKEARCPVFEWEEQGGFGWGWSYMYQLLPKELDYIRVQDACFHCEAT